jgi:hypothetical protein
LFKIDGKQMHGTLTIDEKTLYRIIEMRKNWLREFIGNPGRHRE